MALHIEKVMTKPSHARILKNGRTGFWDNAAGSVVVRNPQACDGGTTFVSKTGIDYFLIDLK